MKKFKLIYCAVFLSIFSLSAQAVKLEIMPTISKAFDADKDSLKDDEILYGLRTNLFLNNEVAIQAGFEASTSNVMSDGGKTDIERVMLNLVLEKDLGSKIIPYALIGGGYEKVHRSSTPSTNDDSQGFANLGIGLKYNINHRINILTEARLLRKLENDDNDVVATIGLGVKLGEIKKRRSHVPSITETSDAENAISLAKLREIQENRKKMLSQQPKTVEVPRNEVIAQEVSTVTTMQAYSQINEIPSNAIILDEHESIEDNMGVQTYIDNSTVSSDESHSDTGYYVQLAALFEGKGESLILRLEQKNYHYMLHNVQRFGKHATLVLVGPYQSRSEAGIALRYLKRLKSDAFIYHLN